MNDQILQLLLRINSDITLTESAKVSLNKQLETCASEAEFREIESALEKYWATVDPIIQGAMARKSPEELVDIEQNLTRMITGTQKIVEESVNESEKQGADNLLLNI